MALRALKRRPDDKSDHGALVVSTAEDEARLRMLVEAELARAYAKPLARRALSLMGEASLEPMAEAPYYRVVDRHGDARYRPAEAEDGTAERGKPGHAGAGGTGSEGDEDSLVPVSLADLVAELRAKHPDLFSDPPPEPEPEAEPAHHAMQETMAHVRAAGARFVETQSALVRSFAHNSAEGSRALASAAGERFGFLRSRLATRRDPAPVSGPPAETPPAMGATPSGMGEAAPQQSAFSRPRSAEAGLGGLQDQAARRDGGIGRKAAFAGLGALGLALVAGSSLLLIRRDPAPDPAPAPPTAPADPSNPAAAPQGKAAAPQGAPAAPPASTATQGAPLPPGAAADPELQPAEPEELPQNANALTGVPEVIDTATLRVSGRLVPLFGVEWVRGGQAEELRKYLAGRSVSCQPAPGSSAYLCTVEGRDLSEVVLFNGGGRASAEATPDLVAAEDHARSERLGVWKR